MSRTFYETALAGASVADAQFDWVVALAAAIVGVSCSEAAVEGGREGHREAEGGWETHGEICAGERSWFYKTRAGRD